MLKSLERTGVDFLKEALDEITDMRRSRTYGKKPDLIPFFKNKGDNKNCRNYRGINLMCHSIKL